MENCNGTIYLVTNTVTDKVYVGKTKHTLDRRWKHHCKIALKGGMFLLHRAIRKYGEAAFTSGTLASNVPLPELDCMERIWIFLMNSIEPKGYNMTSGGDGIIDPCKATRKKMSRAQKRRCLDPERRKQLGEFSRKGWSSPGNLERWLTTRKPIMESAGYRRKLVERNRRLLADPAHRLKMKEAYERREADPEYRRKRTEAVKRPEVRQKIRKTLQEYSSIPEVKKRLSKQARNMWKDPKFRNMKSKNSSETIKRLWKDPSFRAKAAANLRGRGSAARLYKLMKPLF